MTDREKVIKAIECRKNARKRCGNPCEEMGGCIYARSVTDGNRTYLPYYCDVEQICEDTLVLLKEQEKMKVIFKQYDGWVEPECGNCGLYLDKTYSVCPKCGKELDWNGQGKGD